MTADDGVLVADIGELVGVFRDALMAMMPFADRVKMNHHEDDMHPDWEGVAMSLFDAFVRGPINGDRNRAADELPLARYDIDRDNYHGFSWIGVTSGAVTEAPLIRFLSMEKPLDAIQVALIDADTSIVDRAIVPWGELRFAFQRRRRHGPSQRIDEIAAAG
jgi:hypothetical protein